MCAAYRRYANLRAAMYMPWKCIRSCLCPLNSSICKRDRFWREKTENGYKEQFIVCATVHNRMQLLSYSRALAKYLHSWKCIWFHPSMHHTASINTFHRWQFSHRMDDCSSSIWWRSLFWTYNLCNVFNNLK